MTFLQAVVLGLIQGLSEFLPVSSSAHFVIMQKIFNFSEPPVAFNIVLHLGSLLAILLYFRRRLIKISVKQLWLIIIASLPAAILGLLLSDYIHIFFNSLLLVALALLVTGLLLISTKKIKSTKKTMVRIKWQDSLIIGLFQAIAILPGISRSGATIVAGLQRDIKRETAFIFSFYLAVPAILGAAILKLRHLELVGDEKLVWITGLIISAFSSFLSLVVLKRTIINGKLYYFGFYCLVLSFTILTINFLHPFKLLF